MLSGVSALALTLAWLWPLPAMAADLLSAHMAQHLLAMNGGALFLALAWPRRSPAVATHREHASIGLVAATAFQLVLLMSWHLPPLLGETHHGPILRILMQATTFFAALLFWRQIFADDRPLWLRIVSLLVTAKLFCLAGAILIFSRRAIYTSIGDPTRWNMTALSDQQLAGLLMVSACAVIYVTVSTWLFASWLMRGRLSTTVNEEPVALRR